MFRSLTALALLFPLAAQAQGPRAAVAADPVSAGARLDTAQALRAAGQGGSAKWHLERAWVMGAGDAELRAVEAAHAAKGWALDAGVDGTGPWSTDRGLAFAPLSDMSRTPLFDAGQLTDDDGARGAHLGADALLGFGAGTASLGVVARGVLADPDDFSRRELGLRAGLMAPVGAARGGVEVSASKVWDDDDALATTLGARAGLAFAIAPGVALRAEAGVTDWSFEDATRGDGTRRTAALRAIAVPRGDTAVEGWVRASDSDTGAVAEHYTLREVGAQVTREAGPLVLGLFAGAAQQEYEAIDRQDDLTRVGVSATAGNWAFMGFAPKVTVGYEHRDSSDDAYDSDGPSFGASLTKRF